MALLLLLMLATSNAQGPAMWMLPCAPGSPTQQWSLTSGNRGSTNIPTTVRLAANVTGLSPAAPHCWSIEGCFSAEGAKVGVDGCKPLPAPGSCPAGEPCGCNGAFTLKPAAGAVTITSVMDR